VERRWRGGALSEDERRGKERGGGRRDGEMGGGRKGRNGREQR